jgi:peroxiredoxin
MGSCPRLPVRALIASAFVLAALAAASEGAPLEVGKKAPDFSLPSTTGEKITLSQFRGKKAVLVEFYGADFAPV